MDTDMRRKAREGKGGGWSERVLLIYQGILC
jgi:hypothetical protein